MKTCREKIEKGAVKWFHSHGRQRCDVFVHYSSIEGGVFKSLVEGDFVTSEIEEVQKGSIAVNVVKN